ncbi:MAG: zinc ribbon domain-containing protein [Polyangiaceae bacterium]
MPTYEYSCAACGHAWEQVQRISEPPSVLCPKCMKSEAHRLISGGTHFILKGGGWYSDLYSSPKASKGEPATSTPSDSSTGAAAASKTDAKPASPSASAPASPT